MSIKRLIFNTFHSLVIFSVFQFLLSFYIKTNLLRSECDEFNTGQICRAGSECHVMLSIEYLPRLNFGFNAFYSILRLCRGRADAFLIDLESSLLRVLISTPVTSPSSGPVTRHSLLKWRIPVQNCLIILPLPPSASQSCLLSPRCRPFSIKPLQFLPF